MIFKFKKTEVKNAYYIFFIEIKNHASKKIVSIEL